MTQSRLLSLVRSEIRKTGYDYYTEQAYEKWIRHYIRFQELNSFGRLSGNDISEYLANLSRDENADASAQNQALAAILFLYKQVLHKSLSGQSEFNTKN